MTYCTPTPIPDNLPVINCSNYVCPDDVLRGCLKFFGISKMMLRNKSREREVLKPRQMITYILCQYTELTLTNIANIVGYRDHSMVIYTREKVEKDLVKNEYFKSQYQSLKQYLRL